MKNIALHVHTKYSYDCQSDLKGIIKFCNKNKIDSIAITDHDTIKGALELKKINNTNLNIIVGEEITSLEGIHVIGLNLTNHINSLPVKDIVENICDQGGIIYFPHPTRKDGIFSLKNWKKILLKKSFLIEIYNGKLSKKENNSMQKDVNINLSNFNASFLKVEGSDAHYISDISGTILQSKSKEFNFFSDFTGSYIRKKKKKRILISIYYFLNLNYITPKYLKNKLKKCYYYLLD